MTICYPGNHLLHALLASWAELAPPGAPLDLPVGRILQRPGDPVTALYFPVGALLSVQQLLTDGDVIESASIGSEGMSGIAGCLYAPPLPTSQVVVSMAGSAYRLDIASLRAALRQSEALQALLLRYAYSLLTQLGHNHACASRHSTLQRICSWLLYTRSRLARDDILITQDALGKILGVRRESVTQVLAELREKGALRTQRAALCIVDHVRLLEQSCECHGLLHAERDLLLECLDGARLTFHGYGQISQRGRATGAIGSVPF